MQSAHRILILLVVALLLAVAANAVSPRGLSWTEPLGRGIKAKVLTEGFPVVELPDVKRLLEDPRVLFVDARSVEEYKTGHLRGAVLNTSPRTPANRPIVVYCANEFCEQALQDARSLRLGYQNVSIFVDGYDAWWNAGGPVEQE